MSTFLAATAGFVAGAFVMWVLIARRRAKLAKMAAAIAEAKIPLPASGRGKLVIRSVSEKQRPRRKAAQ